MRGLIVALVFVLPSAAWAQGWQPLPDKKAAPNVVTLDAAQVAAIEAGVKDKLRDPGSAKFRRIKAGKDDKNVITVCGDVNAHNGFGGYTGFAPFYGLLARKKTGEPAFVVLALGSDRIERAVMEKMCALDGLG